MTMRLALALVLALTACGKQAADAPKPASCNTSATQTCQDHEAKDPAYLERRAQECKEVGGTWAPTACPTAGVLGSCRETTASWTRTRHYYVGASVDLARAQVECGGYGTWLEPAK